MQDPVLSKYLPDKKQLSGKLPERDFFFGVLGTLKRQYLEDIIKDANEKRFKPSDEPEKKEGILITDDWLKALTAHPYHSSKISTLNYAEKAGTGIFLMRERAKLYKSQVNRKEFQLSKRLNHEEIKEEELGGAPGQAEKRKKGADGKAVSARAAPSQPQSQNARME